MATKTISIDLEAYQRLDLARTRSESFSQAIKRLIHPPVDLSSWYARIDARPLASASTRAIEDRIRSRSRTNRCGR